MRHRIAMARAASGSGHARRRALFALALALSLITALALPVAAHAATGDIFPYDVQQKTLQNGLKVMAIPFDSPGIVAYVTVVRTGSRDEVEPGHSGFAHFFEHMMFRGTKKHPATEYNDALKAMGADSNANTSDDRTFYYIVGPSSKLETMFDLESDRFMNLDYAEDAFRTEAGAILGEYSKNASNPFLPLDEKTRDLAFARHTYKHTTIGFLADVKDMPNQYAYSKSFFQRFYRPENSILLVVGDVKPEQVFTLADKYYTAWKRGYQPPAVVAEPAPAGPQRAHLDWASPTNPYLTISYRTPAFAADRTWAALQVIEQLLFAESAPLYQQLVVDKQWVDFAGGDFDPHRDPYLFGIYARVRGDELMPKVESAIHEALVGLQTKPVDAARLARVKSHLRYAFAIGLDSPMAVARQVGRLLWLTGDVPALNQLWREIDAVTPADVQRAAKEVFQEKGMTVVTLSHPKAAGEGEQKGGSR
ncbi:MAG TPA: pitrilysin family protein [Thermoanaerobaculia bacterium]|nr:pitrilysin family protein [Thermoanaerobaculia bacterium]